MTLHCLGTGNSNFPSHQRAASRLAGQQWLLTSMTNHQCAQEGTTQGVADTPTSTAQASTAKQAQKALTAAWYQIKDVADTQVRLATLNTELDLLMHTYYRDEDGISTRLLLQKLCKQAR